MIIDVIEKTLPDSSFGPPRQLASNAKGSTPLAAQGPGSRQHADKSNSKFTKSKRGCDDFICERIPWQKPGQGEMSH